MDAILPAMSCRDDIDDRMALWALLMALGRMSGDSCFDVVLPVENDCSRSLRVVPSSLTGLGAESTDEIDCSEKLLLTFSDTTGYLGGFAKQWLQTRFFFFELRCGMICLEGEQELHTTDPLFKFDTFVSKLSV